MKLWLRLLFPLLLLAGCSAEQPLTHDQRLPSGKTIKVMSFNMVWGIEHGDRDASKDSLALEYVISDASADQAAKDREAVDAFELIRATSELWGFTHASVSARPAATRRGQFDVYTFTRGADGRWNFARAPLG